MDLPDCPPGAEGYQDSVVEMPKKPEGDESNCTKAEQEFQDHLASLKIRLENGETRPMVERRGRDISGKWIYLCYPCAAVCSGELTLQGHISGRKHKTKLSMRNTWPVSIFDDHPFNQCQKGGEKDKVVVAPVVLKKMKEEVKLHNTKVGDLDSAYAKCREVTCHIQYSIDAIKAPMIGVEYLVEHPPEQEHYEPAYICTLCTKQGHPRTIINHMTCFWHRYNYINRHFPKAAQRLKPLMSKPYYRDGINIVLNRLSQRIEDKYGRLRPIHIDKEVYEREKDKIMQWIYKGEHLTETDGVTFEEVVDVDLIESLHSPLFNESRLDTNKPKAVIVNKKDPSPPRVAAPKYQKSQNTRSYRHERRLSMDLSDISDDETKRKDDHKPRGDTHKPRWEPYQPKRSDQPQEFKTRYALKNFNVKAASTKTADEKVARPPNYEYKVKLSSEKQQAAEEAAKKMLAYHEKNPEKHPLYPEEWKKFWNRRYKEIQAEGKDPSKHDFKPEWIVFWTKRMKELHDEELRVTVVEIYRKMNISPPDMNKKDAPSDKERRRSPDVSERRRRTPDYKKYPDLKRDVRKSPPNHRHRSPGRRSREPRDVRREFERRRTPERLRSSERRRSNERTLVPEYNRTSRRSPQFRPIPEARNSSPPRRRSPQQQARSRSPLSRRSPARTNIVIDSIERSRSPLSRRNASLPLRNRSPVAAPRDPPPSMQTVLVSDDEFKPDDSVLSPWNSDNDIDSVCSIADMRSVAGSAVSRGSRRRDTYMSRPDPLEMGPVENVIATLRMLVALEDYLGSIGPKIVDLLTEALQMEKDEANSSEELLVRDSAVVLIETAKEKLKGAAQAGLVAPAAAPALRACVVRAAATLHEADKRMQRAHNAAKKTAVGTKKTEQLQVSGVGDVDRAQIAQQMAAALIAQGKTDVTSTELAQLVDAVVGMAEAKKREAEAKKVVKPVEKPKAQPKLCGTATALQMLQSAYDENDKKEAAKEEVPDAMDGLSDSDLETLLKNFNELSAEEQHSLIAYLKKLEAREPQRVERLRQYVSAAATSSAASNPPAPVTETPREPTPVKEPLPVVVESDDDDYTVEEVIESAHQKVKEDQMRKEIEIVKKSLEELKEKEATPPPIVAAAVDISNNLSCASDLLALVQASIQSRAPSSIASAISTLSSNVVVNTTQPRSFGDLPSAIESLVKPQNAQFSPQAPVAAPITPVPIVLDEPVQQSPMDNFNEPFIQQEEPMQISNNNFSDEPYNQDASYNQPPPYNESDNYNQSDSFNEGDSYNQGNSYNQGDNYNQPQPYNQNGPYQGNSYNQGDSYNQNEPYKNDNYNQNNTFAQNQPYNQNQNQSFIQPWNNPRQNMPDNRVPMNQGFNNFNQPGPLMPNLGLNQFQPRGNFMNGRQDHKNQNQFGNFNNGNNFRGRGRGNFNGPRGRGRGRFN